MNIYRINEYDWYMANTFTRAVAAAMSDSELPIDDVVNPMECRKLDDEDLDNIMFTVVPGCKITFRQRLKDLESKGEAITGIFASKEW